MTKPSKSLPVLYARVPAETWALAQLLAGHGKTSVSAWLIALIESERCKQQHVADVAAPVKRGRGRPRKVAATDREDGHQRAADAAYSSGDDQ